MIEIVETAPKDMAINSSKAKKIESIVKAWKKIEGDESLSEAQKNIVTRSAMQQVWRIMEGEK